MTSPKPHVAAGTPSGLLGLLQDARARVTRALDAIIDGEFLLAEQILDDLLTDLARAFGRERSG